MIKNSKLIIFVIIIFIGSNIIIGTGDNFKKIMKLSNSNVLIPREAWNKTFGGESLDWGWSVQETIDGGFIIAGETVSFGSGGYDAWLIKTDSNGNETWNKTFGGPSKDGSRTVSQTNDSGYILGGYADSYGYPGHDAWFIKTDTEGNEEWNTTIGGIASDGTFTVIQTSDEGFIGVGYADSYGAGNHDLWLVRTDKYGNEQWNKTYGTADWDSGYSLKECDDGGYIIIGTTQSYGAGNQDAWLIKTDINGVEEWNKTYGGANNDWGSGVIITEDGYYITGDTRSYGPGGYDVWLIKTDEYGNEQWKKVYGEPDSDDTGYSFIQTSDGGFAIVGTKTSFSTQLTDMWLIKTDYNGYMTWNITIDGGEDEWSYSVDETTDGGYIITGRTNSYGSGNYDFWLIKVELVNYENLPPDAPVIDGPTSGKPNTEYEFSFNATDPNDDPVMYIIDWGDNNTEWTEYCDSGEEILLKHTWNSEGIYTIKAKAKDIYNEESDWSESFIIRIGNYPPNKPDINGPTGGSVGKSYEYTFTAIDPDGDAIAEFLVNWGDDTGDETIAGPSPVSASHKWTTQGTYTIKAKAIDTYGAEGPWGELDVTMPKNKNLMQSPFWYRVLERFPILERLLLFIKQDF